MTQEQRAVLERYFALKERKVWLTLEDPEGQHFPTTKTHRRGKLQDGVLYFTIGETIFGSQYGLDELARRTIKQEGLAVVELPSSGNYERIFPGFEVAKCSAEVMERIIKRVMDGIEASLLYAEAVSDHDERSEFRRHVEEITLNTPEAPGAAKLIAESLTKLGKQSAAAIAKILINVASDAVIKILSPWS